MAVRPDLVIEIREDVLEEVGGRMLQHGLKNCHLQSLLVLPTSKDLRPRSDFLEERYERFWKKQETTGLTPISEVILGPES